MLKITKPAFLSHNTAKIILNSFENSRIPTSLFSKFYDNLTSFYYFVILTKIKGCSMTIKEAFNLCQEYKKTQPNLTHQVAYSNYKGFYVDSKTPELSYITESFRFFKLSNKNFNAQMGIKYGF